MEHAGQDQPADPPIQGGPPADGADAAPANGATAQIIGLWADPSAPDFAYFERVEQYTDDFWRPGAQFRGWFDRLDTRNVLEIACGKGRHSERAAALCGQLLISDTSTTALEHAAERLRDQPHVRSVLSPDGMTLPVAEDGTFSAVFSYDAMVHFESDCVASYLGEIARLLEPGGLALLHHSNYSAQPATPVTDAPGWRNYMSLGLLEHLASRRGLAVVEQEAFDWVVPQSDALSLLRRVQ
ncbi:hypothetical protein DSM112329_04913 [Paraconexibacter sp. AEG42_29]|uniref:Methyltransferase domain-containing protein n=1 Tax=Paraconexibacter sp. AEG42_29 TaxID=2997339 RepID=A0AAU7B232_9ACTN